MRAAVGGRAGAAGGLLKPLTVIGLEAPPLGGGGIAAALEREGRIGRGGGALGGGGGGDAFVGFVDTRGNMPGGRGGTRGLPTGRGMPPLRTGFKLATGWADVAAPFAAPDGGGRGGGGGGGARADIVLTKPVGDPLE